MTEKPLTPEKIATIISLKKLGCSHRAIALNLKIDVETVRDHLNLAGLGAPPKVATTPEQERAILAGYQSSMTIEECAELAGVSLKVGKRVIHAAIAAGTIQKRMVVAFSRASSASSAPDGTAERILREIAGLPDPEPLADRADGAPSSFVASLMAGRGLTEAQAVHNAQIAREKLEMKRPGAFWRGPPAPPRVVRQAGPFRLGMLG